MNKTRGHDPAIAIEPDTLLSADPQVLSCDISGEAIILDPRSGTYFGLNAVGATIWSMLGTPHSFSQICEQILSDYDVTPEQCELETRELIEKLLNHRLARLES